MALLWLVVTLPLILSVLFVSSAVITFHIHKQDAIDTCRENLLSLQSRNSQALQRMLSLNPEALRLRAELLLVNQQLLAATIAGQPALIAALKSRKLAIRFQQRRLDQIQKNILQTTKRSHELLLKRAHQIQRNLLRQQTRDSSNWVNLGVILTPVSKAIIAIKPDDNRLAPTYSAYQNFEQKQSVSLSWKSTYQWRGAFEKLIPNQKFIFQCRVSIKEKKWHPFVQKDKLLAKH